MAIISGCHTPKALNSSRGRPMSVLIGIAQGATCVLRRNDTIWDSVFGSSCSAIDFGSTVPKHNTTVSGAAPCSGDRRIRDCRYAGLTEFRRSVTLDLLETTVECMIPFEASNDSNGALADVGATVSGLRNGPVQSASLYSSIKIDFAFWTVRRRRTGLGVSC